MGGSLARCHVSGIMELNLRTCTIYCGSGGIGACPSQSECRTGVSFSKLWWCPSVREQVGDREEKWRAAFSFCLSFSRVIYSLLDNTSCPLAWLFSWLPLPSTGFTCALMKFFLGHGSVCGGRQNSQLLLTLWVMEGLSWLPVACAQHMPLTSVWASCLPSQQSLFTVGEEHMWLLACSLTAASGTDCCWNGIELPMTAVE